MMTVSIKNFRMFHALDMGRARIAQVGTVVIEPEMAA